MVHMEPGWASEVRDIATEQIVQRKPSAHINRLTRRGDRMPESSGVEEHRRDMAVEVTHLAIRPMPEASGESEPAN